MTRQEQLAWLRRRVVLGGFTTTRPANGETVALPLGEIVEDLLNPNTTGTTLVDPFAQVEPHDAAREPLSTYIRRAVGLWLTHMVEGRRPLEEWMTFFWHGHFAVSQTAVRPAHLMFDHIALLRTSALGSFASLVRGVTTNEAMLVFLNGRESIGTAPNENYGRELMELYALGVGTHTEADVAAASRALTGWRVRGAEPAFFRPGFHDPTPQRLLGVDGVHDVDTVIDAVVNHPACAPFVAGKLARAVLGPIEDGLVQEFARVFANANLEIRPLMAAIIDAGLAGESRPIVTQPVPWMISARVALNRMALPVNHSTVGAIRSMGQIPMRPPNVGGFPAPDTYLSAGAIAGRYALATAMADQAHDRNGCLIAARQGNWAQLAILLHRPNGFSETTIAGLEQVRAGSTPEQERGAAALALALASPELLIS